MVYCRHLCSFDFVLNYMTFFFIYRDHLRHLTKAESSSLLLLSLSSTLCSLLKCGSWRKYFIPMCISRYELFGLITLYGLVELDIVKWKGRKMRQGLRWCPNISWFPIPLSNWKLIGVFNLAAMIAKQRSLWRSSTYSPWNLLVSV